MKLSCWRALYFCNVYRLWSFVSLCDLEFDGLTLVKSFKTVALDSGIVDKNIPTAFFFNEPVALRVIEPLNLSSCHQRDLPRCSKAADSNLVTISSLLYSATSQPLA